MPLSDSVVSVLLQENSARPLDPDVTAEEVADAVDEAVVESVGDDVLHVR